MWKSVQPVVVLLLVILLIELPATAKIVVEPGPSELPTDVEYIDDEEIVPIWWNLTPAQVTEYYLVLWLPFLAVPLDLMYSIGAGIYLGYRNASQRRLQDNENRRQILACIRDHPGISRGKICDLTGISIGTAQYHILCLEKAGMIVTIRLNNRRSYFKNSDELGATDRCLLIHIRSTTEEQILTLLLETPDLSQSEIADRVGITGPSISWHMKRLTTDGIVESHRDGRKVRYALTSHAAETLRAIRGEADRGTVRESGPVFG